MSDVPDGGQAPEPHLRLLKQASGSYLLTESGTRLLGVVVPLTPAGASGPCAVSRVVDGLLKPASVGQTASKALTVLLTDVLSRVPGPGEQA